MLLSLAILHVLLASSAQNEPAPAQVITAACGVRVRSSPGSGGKEVTRLGVGVVVDVMGQQSVPGTGDQATTWYQLVKPRGWVSGGLARPFIPEKKWDLILELANARLAAQEAPLEDGMDGVDFLERVLSQDPPEETRASLQLTRLLVLERTVASARRDPSDAHRRWFSQRKEVAEDVAQRLMVPADSFWALYESHRGKPWAEVMAFEASRAGDLGDCEGLPMCTLGMATHSHGRYLKDYPDGPHAAEVMAALHGDLRSGLDPAGFTRLERVDVVGAVGGVPALRRLVSASHAAGREDVLKDLARFEADAKNWGKATPH